MTRRPSHLCLVDSLRSFGGAEVWFLDTARRLGERGLRTSVITQPDAVWRGRLAAAGIEHAAIPLRFDAAPWTWWKLARYFRSRGVTAVIANRTKDLKACAVAGRLARVPVILGTRESDFPLKNKWYYRWYFGRLATGLLVNSRATRDTILASAPYLDPGRVHLLYKGIDTRRFHPAPAAPGTATAGFVGQLIARKGLPEIMAAWSEVADRPLPGGRLPRLKIAGAGPLAAELERWRAGLAHPRQVELCGFVEDMPAFYRSLDLLLMPSHAEGFGLAAAEAAACGVPVIAGDASSLPEIVHHDQTGLLVPPGDAAALATALETLLRDPTRGRRMGLAGWALVSERFDLQTCLDRLVELACGGRKG